MQNKNANIPYKASKKLITCHKISSGKKENKLKD